MTKKRIEPKLILFGLLLVGTVIGASKLSSLDACSGSSSVSWQKNYMLSKTLCLNPMDTSGHDTLINGKVPKAWFFSDVESVSITNTTSATLQAKRYSGYSNPGDLSCLGEKNYDNLFVTLNGDDILRTCWKNDVTFSYGTTPSGCKDVIQIGCAGGDIKEYATDNFGDGVASMRISAPYLSSDTPYEHRNPILVYLGWNISKSVPQLTKITLLSNSIDYANSAAFIAELDKSYAVEIIPKPYPLLSTILQDPFEQHKQDKYIIILGGQEAYDRVGDIVKEILTPEEQAKLKNNEKTYFVKKDKWTVGQTIIIIGGSDRYKTAETARSKIQDIKGEIGS